MQQWRGLRDSCQMCAATRLSFRHNRKQFASAGALSITQHKHSQRAHWRSALDLLQHSKQTRLSCDLVTFNIALNAVSNGDRWQVTLSMAMAEQPPDIYAWNNFLRTISKAKLWSWAVATLHHLHTGQSADVVTYNTAISSLQGQAAAWPQAFLLLKKMQVKQLRADALTSSVAAACVQDQNNIANLWCSSLTQLESTRRGSLPISVFLLGTCVTCTTRVRRPHLSTHDF